MHNRIPCMRSLYVYKLADGRSIKGRPTLIAADTNVLRHHRCDRGGDSNDGDTLAPAKLSLRAVKTLIDYDKLSVRACAR